MASADQADNTAANATDRATQATTPMDQSNSQSAIRVRRPTSSPAQRPIRADGRPAWNRMRASRNPPGSVHD